MKPIFRWAGSKRKLIPVLKRLMPKEFDVYVEPFCGSACLFFDLDRSVPAILGDINPHLINAYRQIRRSPSAIHAACSKYPVNADAYYALRSQKTSSLTVQEQAIRFTYLNRYCFNGVYRTNRNGDFNVPFGSKTGAMPDEARFRATARHLKTAELRCGDFEMVMSDAQPGYFYYLDPPYTMRGNRSIGEYGENSFKDTETNRLVTSLRQINDIGAKFILSYKHDEELIASLSSMVTTLELSVSRHIAGFSKHRSIANEILVRNF